MSKKFIPAISILTCALGYGATSAANPFVESDGIVIMEVESETASGGWVVDNAIFGTSGSYHLWNGQNNFGNPQNGDAITYTFEIQTPGNYEARWRSRNTVSLMVTDYNDAFIRFPTGTNVEGEHPISTGWAKGFMGQAEQWTWDLRTVDGQSLPVRTFFDVGVHTLQIAGRSKGHAIDRVALHQYETGRYDASDFEVLAQSPRQSELFNPRHTYVGNSCVAGQISLAANAAASGDNNTQLLRFALPEGIVSEATNNQAVLSLASTGASLNISAYLGSHNNWNQNTPNAGLPDSTVLLGALGGAATQTGLQSVTVGADLLAGNEVTFILHPDSQAQQNFIGIGAQLEPRLNIEVPASVCNTYQHALANTPFFSDGVSAENENAEENNTNTPDIPTDVDSGETTFTEVPIIVSTGNESDTDIDEDVGSDQEVGSDEEVGSDQEVVNVTPESTERTGERSGGSMSLLLFAAISLITLMRGLVSRRRSA